MSKKERLDVLLVNRGLFESREKAKTAIMAGLVHSPSERLDKAGTKVPEDITIEIKGNPIPYVSRGGLKLKKAIDLFQLSLENVSMIDIGASTGGFTDCALQHGAQKVYAIDVGYNQLAWKLRNDSRVINMEKQNIRAVTPTLVGELVDFISIDVAFISLHKVFPVATQLLTMEGSLVALIKPQFEAGRDNVGKGGIVRDEETHYNVLKNVIKGASESGLYLHGLTYSPIKGMNGNIEFLGLFKKTTEGLLDISDEGIKHLVLASHELKVTK